MAQKRRNTKKKTGTAPKSSAKHGKSASASTAQTKRQTKALLLFALAILMFCLAVIPSGSVWGQLRALLLGLFGLGAFVVPFLVGYIAVISALEKPSQKAKSYVWKSIVFLLLLSTTIQIFVWDISQFSYDQALIAAYRAGAAPSGAGAAGALLGYWLEQWFTDVGAKVIVILLLFVYFMIVTGTTIVTLLKALWKPVHKTKETIETAVETGRKRREAKIDVELDGEETEAESEE